VSRAYFMYRFTHFIHTYVHFVLTKIVTRKLQLIFAPCHYTYVLTDLKHFYVTPLWSDFKIYSYFISRVVFALPFFVQVKFIYLSFPDILHHITKKY
jgi:hypothetical protein